MSYTLGFVSLGCPKNQVDGEILLAALTAADFELVNFYEEGADLVLINTCGFIEAAKKEAIENSLDAAQLKADGEIGAIVVTGCLAERYREEIMREIPEVDAVLGIGANADIVRHCLAVCAGEKQMSFPDKSLLPLCGERLLTTPEYWAYLKIADGCSNRCTYCAIPSIRGDFRSRDFESILLEASQLAAAGTKELVVVAQDTTAYGKDLYGKLRLPELLDELCKIDGIEWIRLLYCYPDEVTDELIDTIASQEKIVNYIDLPLQHAHDGILAAMNRRGTQDEIRTLIEKLRERIPDVVIRTTFITGFPGEGEEEFEALAEFVNEIEFDRLGCFEYSPEEGTAAAELPGAVDNETKLRRGEIIMNDQFEIVNEKQQKCIGRVFKVLVEDYDRYKDVYSGRTYMDAPEIDGCIYFTCKRELDNGDFVSVRCTGVHEYDLTGEAI